MDFENTCHKACLISSTVPCYPAFFFRHLFNRKTGMNHDIISRQAFCIKSTRTVCQTSCFTLCRRSIDFFIFIALLNTYPLLLFLGTISSYSIFLPFFSDQIRQFFHAFSVPAADTKQRCTRMTALKLLRTRVSSKSKYGIISYLFKTRQSVSVNISGYFSTLSSPSGILSSVIRIDSRYEILPDIRDCRYFQQRSDQAHQAAETANILNTHRFNMTGSVGIKLNSRYL